MTDLPLVYMVAHGDTAWSAANRYVGMTDLPLIQSGEDAAKAMKGRLGRLSFAGVFSSPLQRALRTCELAGFGEVAHIDSDLREWNYGEFEGRTEAEIHVESPDWQLFRHGCPRGESPEQVADRADEVITRLRSINEHVLLFSSIHFVRALAIRWVGLGLSTNAKRFMLNSASISTVGYDGSLSRPVIMLWNDTQHGNGAMQRTRLRSA
jgi:probable phosphoglycerate mutase